MVTLLGVGSMIGQFEGVITPVYDTFQHYGLNISKPAIVSVLIIVHFLIGFIFMVGNACLLALTYYVKA